MHSLRMHRAPVHPLYTTCTHYACSVHTLYTYLIKLDVGTILCPMERCCALSRPEGLIAFLYPQGRLPKLKSLSLHTNARNGCKSWFFSTPPLAMVCSAFHSKLCNACGNCLVWCVVSCAALNRYAGVQKRLEGVGFISFAQNRFSEKIVGEMHLPEFCVKWVCPAMLVVRQTFGA